MCRVIAPRLRLSATRGFTLIEAMVALAIMAALVGIGYPTMSRMIGAGRAQNAVEFYVAGFDLANRTALGNNSRSRMLLTPNATSGHYNWQVDACFPATTDCSEGSSNWSTLTTPAAGDPNKSNGFRSVARSADGLIKKAEMEIVLEPTGNDSIYFGSDGWIDQSASDNLRKMKFVPKKPGGTIRTAALVVSLAGLTTRCDYAVSAPDARACP